MRLNLCKPQCFELTPITMSWVYASHNVMRKKVSSPTMSWVDPTRHVTRKKTILPMLSWFDSSHNVIRKRANSSTMSWVDTARNVTRKKIIPPTLSHDLIPPTMSWTRLTVSSETELTPATVSWGDYAHSVTQKIIKSSHNAIIIIFFLRRQNVTSKPFRHSTKTHCGI